MTIELQSRFVAAEDQFLASLSLGQSALSSFDQTWTSLFKDFSAAMRLKQLNAETISVAQVVASRISIIAQNFLSLDVEANQICSAFLGTIESFDNGRQYSEDTSHFSSILQQHAHHWLLQNLHDPYPPRNVKASIAALCQCSIQDVTQWFAEARRRTGWTTLSGEKFAGCRRATAEAASCAFAEDGASNNLLPELRRAFFTMRNNAYNLDLAGQIVVETGCEKQRDVDEELFMKQAHTSDEEDTMPPPPIAGCKRRFEIVSDPFGKDTVSALTSPRLRKRFRPTPDPSSQTSQYSSLEPPLGDGTTSIPLTGTAPYHVPPAPHCFTCPANGAQHTISAAMTDTDTSITSTGAQTSSVGTLSCGNPRKRRLSDSAHTNTPKRPRGLASCARQVVSDPLPSSVASEDLVDEWCQSDFNMQKIMDAWNADLSGLATFAPTVEEEGTSIPSTIHLDVTDAELASASHEGFDLSMFGLAESTAMLNSYSEFVLNPPSLDDRSVSSSPSVESSSDLSEPGFVDCSPYKFWDQEWCQFPDFSSSSAISLPSPLKKSSDFTCSSSSDDSSHTQFGVDPSFISSHLLSDIGELSSLHIPLEAMF